MARQNSVITDDQDTEDDEFEFDENFDLEEDEEVEDDDDTDDADEDSDDEGETESTGRAGSRADDYEARFKGIQASLQRSQEQNSLLQQQVLMAEANAVRAQLLASGIEPEEANRQFQMWMGSKAIELQQHKNATDQEALNEIARTVYLQQLSTDYGIDPKSKTFERLSRLKDPDAMQAFAEEVATRSKTAAKTVKKEVRKATKATTKFDSGGGKVGTRMKKPKNLDDAAAIFSKYKIGV